MPSGTARTFGTIRHVYNPRGVLHILRYILFSQLKAKIQNYKAILNLVRFFLVLIWFSPKIFLLNSWESYTFWYCYYYVFPAHVEKIVSNPLKQIERSLRQLNADFISTFAGCSRIFDYFKNWAKSQMYYVLQNSSNFNLEQIQMYLNDNMIFKFRIWLLNLENTKQ